MRKYRLPFRAGHHFAAGVADYAKDHNIRPTEFPYGEARRIYGVMLGVMGLPPSELPITEAEFRAALDPVMIVRDQATAGGPQPAEVTRMLAAADEAVAQQDGWLRERRTRISTALDGDPRALLGAPR